MTKEKTNFLLGLVTGIAIVSLVGLVLASGTNSRKANEGNVGQAPDNQANKNIAPTPTPTPSKNIQVTDSDHIRGNKNAKITIVEYSDFQCPFCSRFHDTMIEVMQNYPNEVRWVYKYFPLDSIHPVARKAAEASECAGDQGKFWEYADELYKNQRSISEDYLSEVAQNLQLNTKDFDTCLSAGKYSSKVNNNFLEGQQVGVRGTPGVFINGQALRGAEPYSSLKTKIDNLK